VLREKAGHPQLFDVHEGGQRLQGSQRLAGLGRAKGDHALPRLSASLQQISQVEGDLGRLFSPVLSLQVGLTLPTLFLTDVCTTRSKAPPVIEDLAFLRAVTFWGYLSLL